MNKAFTNIDMVQSARIFLLLGSNLGDRLAILDSAKTLIAEKAGTIVQASSIYETEPWGLTDQPAFLNQVIEISSEQAPEEILRIVLDIEHILGRIRYERWGARAIDIDMLYYGGEVLDSARLTLPHPRIAERRFTLIPLAEISPLFIHPITGQTTLEMLESCTDNGVVIKIS